MMTARAAALARRCHFRFSPPSSSSFMVWNERPTTRGYNRSFSTDTSASTDSVSAPLLLSVDASNNNKDDTDDAAASPMILYPRDLPVQSIVYNNDDNTNDAINEIVASIHRHYGDNDAFVGGMGESDGGVSLVPFTTSTNTAAQVDPWIYLESLWLPAIASIQESRHGVPFSIYTSGTHGLLQHNTSQCSDAWLEMLQSSFSTIHVSLPAANPNDYGNAQQFGAICSFLVEAHEAGLPLEVVVPKEYGQASAARDLALSLGARQVHVI